MSGLYHKVIKLEQNYSEKKAALLEFSLRRVKGVVSACVLPNNSLSVYTNDLKTLSYALYKMELLSVKDKIKAKESEQETEIKNAADELKSYKLKALVSLVGFGLLEITKRMAPATFTRLSFARSAFVMLIAKDIFKEGFAGLIRDKAPNADTLTATAVLASLLSGKPESSLSLLVLSNFAEMLTIGAAEKARQHISTLLDMKEKYVWLKDLDGHIRKVDIDSVKLNDRVVVYVGEKICVDGTIVEGGASIDQSSLTGESIPAYKTVGEDVYAGTVVRSGEITIEVSKVGDETNLARIINMVENAQNRRAPIQNFADRMANALVPISFLSAAVVYAVTKDIQRVLNMFFIDFSCGLKLSTSTAISASISKAAQMGVLVKGGNFIETLADIDTVILDKTGTITNGHPILIDTIACKGVEQKELVQLAAAAEKSSSHPLAEAIINYADEKQWVVPDNAKIETVVGRGISASVDDFDGIKGGELLVGSFVFMTERGVRGIKSFDRSQYSKECNIIYVARSSKLLGALVITDPIRKDIKKTINRIRRNGVDEIVMLTGDNKVTAEYVAAKLDLDGFKSDVLPHEKAEFVASKQSYSKVLMVGDGINDAPVLKRADIGISMGGVGTDSAIEASDIVLMSDELDRIPLAIDISRYTKKIIRQNLLFAMAVKVLILILSVLGKANMWMAVFADTGVTLLTILNTLRIMKKYRD